MQALPAWVNILCFRVPTPNTVTITVVSRCRRAMHLAGLYCSPGSAPSRRPLSIFQDRLLEGVEVAPADCGEAMLLPTVSQAE
jgi:hypothetical protein